MKRDGLKYLTRREKQALAEYLTRLREQFGDQVQRVILYGSKVRGDFDAESDIDVFIVFDKLDQTREDTLTWLALDVDLKYNILLSDFLVNRERFARMAEIQEPLYQDLMSEGVDLWTRTPAALFTFGSPKRKTTSNGRAPSLSKGAIAKRSVARTTRSLPSRPRRS
ncbi:MAG: nucleotidyltransferase domain-containing protein [Chloroflexi bacterium]|nr:nucleotidyltransferase domain-containing protein [Chloroflexota bacterium]